MTFAQPFAEYEILERVGAGAMGTVFKARHKKLGRIVALKVLRPSLARNTRYVDRLRREARIVASLNHPNIVTGYDLGEEGGYHFFVMEFVAGRSLRSLLAEWGMFPEDQVLNVALQVAQALDHAYQKGVIHRDVKPGNVLIDDDGEVMLTDMGLAKGPTDLTLTRDGATVGTPQYISPEQARDPQSVDVRSDLYSLGATLYHMATGQPPFRGGTMAEVITRVLHERTPSAAELNPNLSAGLSLVIRKLMAKDPGLRYQNPGELLDDLERVQRDEIPAVDRGRLDAADSGGSPPARRRAALRLGGAIAGVVALLALGLIVGLSIGGNGAPAGNGDGGVLAELETALAREIRNSPKWAVFRNFESRITDPLVGEFQRRRGEFLAGVQTDLDLLVRRYFVVQREDLVAKLVDVGTWPDAEEFLDGELTAEMLRTIDFPPGDLPIDLELGGLDQLRAFVRQTVQRRDAALLADLDAFLEQGLPARCQALVAAGDFAGAVQRVRGSLSEFLDGVQRPREDLLAPGTRENAVARHSQAVKDLLPAIAGEEQRLARALQDEAAQALAALAEWRAAENPDPAVVAGRIERLGLALHSQYPDAASFTVGANPWAEVDRQLNEAARRADLDAAERQAARLRGRLDLAYRMLVHGARREALGAFDGLELDDPGLAAASDRHRAAIAGVDAVAAAVLDVLAESGDPLWARPRLLPMARLPLRVTRDADGELHLSVTRDGSEEEVALQDLAFSPLLAQAKRIRPGLLAALPADQAELGVLLLACLSDDFSRVLERIATVDDRFFVDEVWARVEHVRRSSGLGDATEPSTALAALFSAWQTARRSGELAPLEGAVRDFGQRFAVADLTRDDAVQLADCQTWLAGEQRRRALIVELRDQAPQGVDVSVSAAERGGLDAVLVYPAETLAVLETGWRFRDGAVAPGARAGGWQPLVLAGVLPAKGPTSCTLDVVFPARGAEPRVWLFEFGTVGLVVSLLADDSVVAAIVDVRDLSRSEALQRAMREPLTQVALQEAAVAATPGAVHRLTLRVEPVRGARYGVQALLDGAVVARGIRELDAERRASVTIEPLQPLELHSIELRASGL